MRTVFEKRMALTGCVYSPKQVDLKQICIHTWKNTKQLETLGSMWRGKQGKRDGN